MNKLRVLAVGIAAVAVLGFSGGNVGATCALDAHIAAQQTAISGLQAQLATATPREAFVLNAQIAARQAAVADMQAQCA